MTRPLRVFLCHASQDKPAVRELYSALKAEGWIDPWLDKAKILPGQDWEMVIEKAVDDSDVVIACLSSQSVTKEGFVQREIRYAYDMALEKPEETIFLIPLRLDDCNVPRKLRTLHWVDYFGVYKEDSYLDLVKALRLRYEQKLDSEADELVRKNAAQKIAREKLEIEVAENAVREKLKREAAKIAEIERLEREAKVKSKREIKEKADRERRRKKQKEFLSRVTNLISSNSRLLVIGGIALMILILGGFGLNNLINRLPVATAVISSPTVTQTIEPPTLTSVPITSTPQPTKTSIPTPIPTLGIGSTMTGEKGETLVYVPAGKFIMGINAETFLTECRKSISGCQLSWFKDEEPIHEVELNAFWIDQTEVTNKMYSQCVEAHKCDPPEDRKSYTRSNYYGNSEFDNYPIIYVNWNMATAYCSWVGSRLPTEAEWEKAARGPSGNNFPWGNAVPNNDLSNYNGNVGDTTEVGKYPNGASIYGALDMEGNVREWVNDWYSDAYYQISPLSNPLGPSSSNTRVFRSGSWYGDINFARSAGRGGYTPSFSGVSLGFRCARSQ